jgi:hypothetical protein
VVLPSPLHTNPTTEFAVGKIDLDAAEDDLNEANLSQADPPLNKAPAAAAEMVVQGGHLPGDTLRERLEEFYRRHNPEHIDNIDKVLKVYEENPDCIVAELDKKYGTHYATEEEQAANADRMRLRQLEREALEEENRLYEMESRSIKLGLGDFVFYSIAIARAASYGWMEAISVFVVILMVRTRVSKRVS